MNHLIWVRRMALGLAASAAMWGQLTPPAYSVNEDSAPVEVKEALRARATEFFNYHVGPANRRAIDLVAEDTKDYYFQSGKEKLLGFTLTSVNFTPDLQKAFVKIDVRMNREIQGMTAEVVSPSNTTWKMEDDKWVFFLDVQNAVEVWRTPMGPSAVAKTVTPGVATNPDGTLFIPTDFAKPERLQEQAQAILAQAGVDKSKITFTSGAAGEDKVTFHNGFRGQVMLKLLGDPHVPGLTVTLQKPELFANEDAVVVFKYDPPEDTRPDAIGSTYTLRLELIPFNQEYPIQLVLQPNIVTATQAEVTDPH